MKGTRRRLALLLIVVFMMSLCACGKTPIEKSNEPEKSLTEQIDEQLTGTWISQTSDTVVSRWTVYNGMYVVDTYVNGNKIENSTVGTYAIGSDAIHTITSDQKVNVEGSIPFTFNDGKLMLNGAVGTLEKER